MLLPDPWEPLSVEALGAAVHADVVRSVVNHAFLLPSVRHEHCK